MNLTPVRVIAVGSFIASAAMSIWLPFVPLYMKELGAETDATALAWVGVAFVGQGVGRLVAGPLWGVMSDRFGRKVMLVRALYFASLTTAIAAIATEPWHVAIAFVFQGVFSGFNPASVALTSVTVPESQLSSSLSLVTGGQYLGNTIGPLVGAGLALVLDLRGAILVGAAVPAIAAVLVTVAVPRDVVRPRRDSRDSATGQRAPRRLRGILTGQLQLALFLYFFTFTMAQIVKTSAPLFVGQIAGVENAPAVVGIAFTLAGIASVVGVLYIGRRWVRPGSFVPMLTIGTVAAAVGQFLLASSSTVPLFLLAFSTVMMAQAAMLPPTNTLIASAVDRDRRGTVFGLASGAQALANIVGPLTAAGIAAVSLSLGYALMGVLFLLVGVLLLLKLREPVAIDTTAIG